MTPAPEQRGIQTDPWFHEYASRTAGLSASEVRALFAVASRPEVVSLAGGMPFVSALPRDLIESSLEQLVHDDLARALQYGSGQGDPTLREQILELMAIEGIHGSADDVVITTGSQQALDLIAKLFLDPGDVVIAEGPSYVGAIGVFRSYQAETVHVTMDDDGLVPELLDERLTQLEAEEKRVKLLYTIPNFHNPAGVTLAAERRPRILEVAAKHHVLVLEDNPYGLLHFDHPVPDALRSLDDQNVVYLGSFSKILAPGFRIGYVLAPHAIREKLVLANESAVLSPNVFGQLVISRYLSQADWRGQIDTFRGLYRERRDAMLAALDKELPSMSWTRPNGGFYVWLQLPEQLDSKAMLPLAVSELVAYTPGTAFYADGTGQDKIRLSFCYPTPEEIGVGIRRLATVIDNETELIQTFKPQGLPRSTQGGSFINSPPPNLH